MPDYKVVCVDGSEGRNNPSVRPFLVSVPEEIRVPDQDAIKNWALRLQWSDDGIRRWSNTQMQFTEKDAEESQIVKAMFDAVDWDSVTPSWFEEPKDPQGALEYARIVRQAIPKYEHIIARDSDISFSYSCEIDNPFPAGERLIAQDPPLSIKYADVHGIRLPEAEDRISENDLTAEEYGKVMNSFCLWDSWGERELTRSPVWMYLYSEQKGRLSESLHSAMVMFSFKDANNKWIKKYFKNKKRTCK